MLDGVMFELIVLCYVLCYMYVKYVLGVMYCVYVVLCVMCCDCDVYEICMV
jgi:hypothetical protein